jgi:hypothetical protein
MQAGYRCGAQNATVGSESKTTASTNELLLGQRATRVNLFGPAAADERDEDGDDEQDSHCNLGQEQTDEEKQHQADHQYRHQGERKAFDWVHEHNVPQAELNCKPSAALAARTESDEMP